MLKEILWRCYSVTHIAFWGGFPTLFGVHCDGFLAESLVNVCDSRSHVQHAYNINCSDSQFVIPSSGASYYYSCSFSWCVVLH